VTGCEPLPCVTEDVPIAKDPPAYDQIVSRRVVWIVLAMIAIATTGFLLAVLGPRSSDELPPRTVTVEKTITMPPGTPTVPPGMATVP
jgi:hypothetical protein